MYFSVEVNGKPACLICNKQIAVAKDYNVRRHYESNHALKFDKYSGKLREDKVIELEQALNKQQSVFKKVNNVSDAVVRASYRIANEIAVSSKPFTEGDFIKKCMMMASEDVCPEKRQAFANISLSKNTVAERISELGENIDIQLKEKVQLFTNFSVAIDESTDITDIEQLAVFIRGVDKTMKITEEFVELVPMRGTTTADDIFASLVGALDKLGVKWSHLISLATDGAPQMIGKKTGVATKLKEKLLSLNPNQEFYGMYCIIHREVLCSKTLKMDNVMNIVIKTVNFIRARGLNHRQFNCFLEENDIAHNLPYHNDVRWLSRGVVLKRFYELRNEIQKFMEFKGKEVVELKDDKWVLDLAFLVDITGHLNSLNTKMQGSNKLITQLYDSIRAFEMKLQLFEKQLKESNLAHFPTLKSFQDTVLCDFNISNYCNKISNLRNEFKERFSDLKYLEKDFAIFQNPFSVSISEVLDHLQLELIELQCDSVLKTKFSEVDIATYYQYLGPNYPNIKCLASKILAMFGTTFVCEQHFSIMNLNKTRLRSSLSNVHLNSILKVATAKSLLPNYDLLVNNKRCQKSGSNSSYN